MRSSLDNGESGGQERLTPKILISVYGICNALDSVKRLRQPKLMKSRNGFMVIFYRNSHLASNRTNKGHEKQIANEVEEESIDDHFFGNRGSSKDCNATSSRTSLPSHFHGFHEDQEHLGLAGDAGNPTMGDNQQHSHHLASAFNGEELRGTSSRPRGFVLG